MFYLDVIFSVLLWYVVIPVVTLITFTLFLFKNVESVRRKAFAFAYVPFTKPLMDLVIPDKKVLFEDMSSIKSHDKDLRNRGEIRILEVGAGPGNNFQFYPENSRIIIVEPNHNFSKIREERQADWPTVKVEKAVVGAGEDMSEVADNYVDAVVVTYVLCTVDNIDAVLKEIHRVLAPGGKFYFLEHGYGRRGRWQWMMQNGLNPVWKIVFDGCNLNRNVGNNIRNSGLFENVEINVMSSTSKIKGDNILGHHFYGTALKSC